MPHIYNVFARLYTVYIKNKKNIKDLDANGRKALCLRKHFVKVRKRWTVLVSLTPSDFHLADQGHR